MGKVYTAPKSIKKPEFEHGRGQDWKEFDKLEAAYEKQIVEWAKKHGKGPEAGEEVNFPVADGSARYIVLSLKPVQLIHVDTGDAWHFQYVTRLTAVDLRKQIASAKSLRELFHKKEKEACLDKIITQADA